MQRRPIREGTPIRGANRCASPMPTRNRPVPKQRKNSSPTLLTNEKVQIKETESNVTDSTNSPPLSPLHQEGTSQPSNSKHKIFQSIIGKFGIHKEREAKVKQNFISFVAFLVLLAYFLQNTNRQSLSNSKSKFAEWLVNQYQQDSAEGG